MGKYREVQLIHCFIAILHPWKLTSPLKRDYFNRKYIFQPLIFRGHVSFRGGNWKENWERRVSSAPKIMASRKNFAPIFPRRNDPPIVEGFENLQLPTTVSWRKSTRTKNPPKMKAWQIWFCPECVFVWSPWFWMNHLWKKISEMSHSCQIETRIKRWEFPQETHNSSNELSQHDRAGDDHHLGCVLWEKLSSIKLVNRILANSIYNRKKKITPNPNTISRKFG